MFEIYDVDTETYRHLIRRFKNYNNGDKIDEDEWKYLILVINSQARIVVPVTASEVRRLNYGHLQEQVWYIRAI